MNVPFIITVIFFNNNSHVTLRSYTSNISVYHSHGSFCRRCSRVNPTTSCSSDESCHSWGLVTGTYSLRFCVYTLVSLLYFMIFSLGAHHKLWWLVIADSTTGLQLVGAEKLVLLTHISPVFSQTIMFNETASTGIPPRRYIIVTLPLRLRCQTTFVR